MIEISLPKLISAGVHFGFKKNQWNPKIRPYLFLEYRGLHIIDLVYTQKALMYSFIYIREAAKKGSQFLFIGTKKEASEIIAEEATKCGAHFVNHRWVGGTLTNWFTMKNRVSHLRELKEKEKKGELNTLPKKDAVVLRRKRYKLEKSLGGLINMLKIPDIVIVVDPKQEATAIAECRKLGIKIFSILDTNCDPDPTLVGVPIPGNTASKGSLKCMLSVFTEAICKGN